MSEISGQSAMDGRGLSGGSQAEGSQNGQSGHSGHRENILVRIRLRKQQVYEWPNQKKLLKLAVYRACHDEGCKCTGSGWKTTPPPGQTIRIDDALCRNCRHSLEQHLSHLRPVSDAELNRLLSMVVDIGNIYMNMTKEEDPDKKRVYVYLLKLLRRCIVTMTKPTIASSLGQPPFETPNITKAVTNFVDYKFGNSSQREWQTMLKLAKLFIHCLNRWKYESPSLRKQHSLVPEALSPYKINYLRWLVFCHVPAFCDSLTHFNTSAVFGKQFLRAVFKTVFKQFIDNCHAARDRMQTETRIMVLTEFPKFLQVLEEEIYAPNSPIFDPEFKAVPPPHF